jgi:hypothetical protein
VIWLTWRQFRVPSITAAAALAVFAILLAATGPHLASLYTHSDLSGCHAGCAQLANNFLTQLTGAYAVVYVLGIAIILLAPAVIGLFWGAPLVARELEAGTSALAWNQSITRTRWLAVKLTLTGLAAMAVTEALSLMQTWWAAPIGRAVGYGGNTGSVAQNWSSALVFASHGITPLGYAAFAFALGVTAGTFLRRTVPAMAVTLVVFAAVQLATPLAIRPHVLPARHTVISIVSLRNVSLQQGSHNGANTFKLTTAGLPGQPRAWVLSSGAVNATGQPVSTIPAACTAPAIFNGPNFFGCLGSHGIRESVTYQPGSRYWPLQWVETAAFLVIALALAGCCFWRLSRRQT